MNLYNAAGTNLGYTDQMMVLIPLLDIMGVLPTVLSFFSDAINGTPGSVYISDPFPGDTGPTVLAVAPVADASGTVVNVLVGEVELVL